MAAPIPLMPLHYNQSAEDAYFKSTSELVRGLIRDVAQAISLFEANYSPDIEVGLDESPLSINSQLKTLQRQYDANVNKDGKLYALRMIADQLRASNLAMRQSIKSLNPDSVADKDSKDAIILLLALLGSGFLAEKKILAQAQEPLKYVSPTMRQAIQASLFQNLQYMRDIGSKYITDVLGSVMRNISKGNLSQLREEVMDFSRKTLRRTQLVCADQTRKAYQAIALRNMAEAGITKFRWVYTYRSKEPRPYHRDTLHNQIFDINDPPIIDEKTGERGFPSQLPQCKCVMQPVIM